ncbi:alkaline phosphatase family protein [Sodalis ligni]|jgi:predicted AlkP superfamily phosphohydrolase/phosphomutase|uniref:Type I phosphodiesterase/nucleotide pyrophosphatase n=1 Tax=Sodalis ligni TaxID=2697027 RepID=A0A4R1N7L2_9GAMM|nr:alkaline phosphatase family protein [Sodalis ligni]TCL03152.1 type I phosphodiesterase/nucleotide pyrophosphatase [Sodalis ligni]
MRKVIIFGVDGLTMPLIKKFTAEGILPHIGYMFAKGSAAELLPFISAWGDVNWVTLLSGLCPGSSWIGQSIPADNVQTANLLSLLQDKGLTAALVHFPETVSAPPPHFEFAPYWGQAKPWPAEISKPMGYTTRYEERTGRKVVRTQKLGWPPSAALAYHEKGTWQPLGRNNGGYTLKMRGSTGQPIDIVIDCAGVNPLARYGDLSVELRTGAWSQWLPVETLGADGKVRFFLGSHDVNTGDMDILQSQITVPSGLYADRKLGRELIEKFGPFISKWTVKASPNETYRASAYEEADYQSLWLADSAIHLTQQRGFSLWATVHRLVDESHHNCLGQCDPQSPFYDPDTAPLFEDVMRECYKILDKTIGRILSRLDHESTLLLVSDHGAVPNEYMCDVYRYLAKSGLTKLDEQGRMIVGQSKVYLKDERGGLEIYVNLQGREAGGIVPRSEYESVREEVLHALGNWHVLHQGKIRNAVGLALRKEDASGIGYWGCQAGDIVFAYNTGFVWGVSATGEDICPVDVPGANHGPQKPTAETAMASNYGVMLAYGTGIKEGYYRDRQAKGPYRMVDPAATIAHLLQLDPTTLDGTVMHDFLANGR